MENVFQLQKPLRLLFFQLPHRDLRPSGHHICDLILVYNQFSGGLFLLPLGADGLDLFPHLLLSALNLAGLLIGLSLHRLFLLRLQSLYLLFQGLNLLRLHEIRQPYLGGSLIN